MNEVILSQDNLVLKRFWSLDNQAYADGALPSKTKEFLGLVASMVLRCDDCIKYHLGKCHELNCSTEEIYEVFAIQIGPPVVAIKDAVIAKTNTIDDDIRGRMERALTHLVRVVRS